MINMRQEEKKAGKPTEIKNLRVLKIIFPIAVTTIVALFVPTAVPLIGMLMFGNLIRECGAEVEFVFANDPRVILKYTKNVLNCDIHTRERTRRLLRAAGAEKVFGYEYLSGSNLLHRLTNPNGIKFQFKWADSESKISTMEQFYTDGDAAPLGRLNYTYQNCIDPKTAEQYVPVGEQTTEIETEEQPEQKKGCKLTINAEIAEMTGNETNIYFSLSGKRHIARIKTDKKISSGDSINLIINPETIHYFDTETTAAI